MAISTVFQELIIDVIYRGNPSAIALGNIFQVALIDDSVRSSFSFSVNTSTNVFTATGHTFTNGTRVTAVASGGGLVPSPLVENTNYYVRDAAPDIFKLAATRGGAAIDITTLGTGTLLVTDVALDQTVRDVVDFTRKELTNYQAQLIRPSVTVTGAPILLLDPVTNASYISITVNALILNSAGTNPLIFNAVLLINGGSTAIANTTGIVADYTTFPAIKTIPAGQSDQLSFEIKLFVPASPISV